MNGSVSTICAFELLDEEMSLLINAPLNVRDHQVPVPDIVRPGTERGELLHVRGVVLVDVPVARVVGPLLKALKGQDIFHAVELCRFG
jgi:hypothetical protein